MGWYRDYTDGASDDSAGGGSTSLRYVVTGGYTAAQIIADPTAIRNDDQEPLPGYGSSHPEDPRMLLDRYEVSTEGQVARVVGVYSIRGTGRLPQPTPPQAVGQARFENDSETFSFILPYSQLTVERVPDPDSPGDFLDIDVWKPGTLETYQDGDVQSIRVVVPANQYNTLVAAVGAQANRLHLFFGRYWQFRRAAIRYRPATDDYETTYSWFNDPGFDLPDGYNDMSTQTFPRLWPLRITGVTSGTPMTRPPFHRIVDDPNNNNADLSVPQEYVAVLAYTIDANGWQSLPGVPNL